MNYYYYYTRVGRKACAVEGWQPKRFLKPYLIFVIFFTLAKFLEKKIYTEKRQFFALNL